LIPFKLTSGGLVQKCIKVLEELISSLQNKDVKMSSKLKPTKYDFNKYISPVELEYPSQYFRIDFYHHTYRPITIEITNLLPSYFAEGDGNP
jgi:hypothetical protein